MADINSSDVKLKQSQRLDDTEFGGGAMIATEVVDGLVNNLFPDISRLDRVYGRVSMRKAFLNIETENRATYYGSNVVITEQASDPKVSVCFFTTQDWFDTRSSAKSRVEAYLVKGPTFPAMFWADHYLGSRQINVVTEIDQLPPDIGDVILVTTDQDLAGHSITELEQYVRITEVSSEIRTFTDTNGALFDKRAMYIEVGSRLLFDIPGDDPVRVSNYANLASRVILTVVADASTYYSVAQLEEDITAGELQLRVDSIFAPIVPSAASETGIVDAVVGYAKDQSMGNFDGNTVIRSLSMTFAPLAQVFMGEAIIPGTWSCAGTYTLTADVPGNVYYLGTIVGSIEWNSGTVNFGADVPVDTTNTHTFTYDPGAPAARVMETSGIVISEATRGRAYTFRCDPLPQPGTVRIDYIAQGKWYTLFDDGTGRCAGTDPSLGTATVNFDTGSISIGLGEAQPDVDSMIIVYWGTAQDYFTIANSVSPWYWEFTLSDTGISQGTLVIEWTGNSIEDRGLDGTLDHYQGATLIQAGVGTLNYNTGEVVVEGVEDVTPLPSQSYTISYNQGDPTVETWSGKTYDDLNRFELPLTNSSAIIPHTLVVGYTTYGYYNNRYQYWFNNNRVRVYTDDGVGGLEEFGPDTIANWTPATVDYSAPGHVALSPNRSLLRRSNNWAWGVGATRPTATDTLGPVGSTRYIAQITTARSGYPYYYYPGSEIFVSYQESAGLNSISYSTTIQQKYNLDPDEEGFELIAGSVKGTVGGITFVESGGVVYEIAGGTSATQGEEIGLIDYLTNTIILTTDRVSSSSDNLTVDLRIAQGVTGFYPITEAMFRTPGAPVRVESLTLYAEDTEGNVVTASSNSQGQIIGDYMQGNINYETGVCIVSFGQWVTDDAGSQAEDWWTAEQVDNGEVWQPWPVQSNSVLMNCVITSYLPLDADLLGLNPVRLPLDGKIPIFRDAGIILIHDTKSALFPTTVIDEQVVSVGRTDVEVIRLIDDTGAVVPEIDDGTPLYSVDTDLGTLTVINATLLNTHENIPLNIINRIEDMVLASDVQVTGHIAIVNAVTHDYVAGEALVSSVLPSADLQSRIENEFEQDSWTGVWSDEPIGGQPLASYDVVNYPITVQNIDAVEERFACIFSSDETIQLVGENLGIIYEGTILSNIEINNPQSPGSYFFIDADGWGLGWSTGDVFRFNSKGANYPLWFIRTTLQGPPTESTDNYVTEIRGDSS